MLMTSIVSIPPRHQPARLKDTQLCHVHIIQAADTVTAPHGVLSRKARAVYLLLLSFSVCLYILLHKRKLLLLSCQ